MHIIHAYKRYRGFDTFTEYSNVYARQTFSELLQNTDYILIVWTDEKGFVRFWNRPTE